MKNLLRKHLLRIIGVIVGTVAGFSYYHFIGCSNGTCPISSNPYISMAYGAIMGYLLFDMFKKKKPETK
jgi:LytS/YehU family sensor histidine kinase